MTMVSINGTIYDKEDARISVFDHGFLYGDSVYETIRTMEGEPFLLKEHLIRLRQSCESIQIECAWSDEKFLGEMKRLSSALKSCESLYRIIITRGTGTIGYRHNPAQKPTIILYCSPFVGFPPEAYQSGIRLSVVSMRRNHRACLNPSIKSSNLLNLRLAFHEAAVKDADEALMLNLDDEIAECSSSTIFFVKKKILMTPSLDSGILPGITRQFVLTLARREAIEAREERLPRDIIEECDECFITSTIKSILPVHFIDERELNSPGPITIFLMKAFDRAVSDLSPLKMHAEE
jgi:branched-chain amino acid aminotransferase